MQVENTEKSSTATVTHSIETPLRLPGSPVATLPGYLRFEDVLNRVGERDHPDEWGRLPGWSVMPFRWSPSRRQYVRHELGRVGGRARLRTFVLKLDLSKDERRSCTRVFKSVRNTVRDALEARTLHAHAVHDATGLVTPMEAPAIWRKQVNLVFMTGRTVIRQAGVPDQLADVVVKVDAFERWMAARAKLEARNASNAALAQAGKIIQAHEDERGYTIIRADALKLCRNAAKGCELKVSEKQFDKHLWTSRKASAGPQKKESKKRFEDHRDELAARLTAHFAGQLVRETGETVRHQDGEPSK